MSYKSQNTFDGSYAAVSDAVVLMTGEGLSSGVINRIVPGATDDITIWVYREERERNNCSFVATATAGDIEAMSENQWTWPVSV